jgi:hypothetical protein
MVENDNNKTVQDGNGVNTSFSFTFQVSETDGSDIEIYITDTSGNTGEALSSGYLITLNNPDDLTAGGYVTYPFPTSGTKLQTDEKITIARVLSITSDLDLENTGPFIAQNVENAIDKVTMIAQQLNEASNRTIKADISVTAGANYQLPAPVAGKVVGWDATATKFYNYDNPGTAQIAAAASADLAEKWANEDEDVEVETGKYSALHFAAKAEEQASTAETSSTNAATSESNALDYKNSAEISAATATSQAQMALNIASGSPKGVYATLVDLQTAYPDGDTGIYVVVADGNWYYFNGASWDSGGTYQATGIADDSVTVDKTNFIALGKNIFNKDTAIEGYYVSNTTGGLSALPGYYASDYISIKPSTNYVRNNNQLGAFYDSSKQYISGINNVDSTFASPPSAVYMRLTILAATIDTFQLEEGTTSTDYEPYQYNCEYFKLLNQNISESSISSDKLSGDVGIILNSNTQLSKNLFDKTDVTNDKYLSEAGLLVDIQGFSVSGYISVNPSTIYIRNAKSNGYDNCYTSNKSVIGRIDNTLTITTPSNAAYVRLTVPDAALDTLQFESGSESTDYEPYGISLAKLKITNNNIAVGTIANNKLVTKTLTILDANFLYADILMRRNGLVFCDNLKTNGFSFSYYLAKDDDKLILTLPDEATSVSFYYYIKDAKDLIDISGKGIVVNFDILNNATNNIVGVCSIYYNGSDVLDQYTSSIVTSASANLKTVYTSLEACTDCYFRIVFSYDESDSGKTIELSNFIVYASESDLKLNSLDELNKSLYMLTKNEESRNKWYGKKLIGLGDSITYLKNSYFNILKGIVYFKTCVNAGVSGTTVAHISVGDNCFVDRVSSLDTDGDLYLIFGGANDANNNVLIGTIGNGDTSTFIGAYQYVIETILTNNPKAKIGLIAPYKMTILGSIDATNAVGLAISDYVTSIKTVAEYYSIPCLDLYHTSGCNAQNIATLLSDGTHPTFDFGYILAHQINAFIDSI